MSSVHCAMRAPSTKCFKELSRGNTVVLISHRFSSVGMADRIVVLKDGTVEAEGARMLSC